MFVFFDPEKYDDCSHKHQGDVGIFGNSEYQSRFTGFIDEIEKYPEFQKKTNLSMCKY